MRGDLAETVTEPVDACERGEGVVYCGREGPDRDLRKLVDREREVLCERAVRAGRVRPGEPAAHLGRSRGGPDPGEGQALHHEVTGPVKELDDCLACSAMSTSVGYPTNWR